MGVAKAALEASVRYLAYDLGTDEVRVNAISAGPVKTLSAGAFSGFRKMMHYVEERAPLRRNITQEEVAKAALFLLGDLSSGVTGEVMHVDAGYNILGMMEPVEGSQ
jgi:enoyl-[acyl-carrier protein] reductase I